MLFSLLAAPFFDFAIFREFSASLPLHRQGYTPSSPAQHHHNHRHTVYSLLSSIVFFSILPFLLPLCRLCSSHSHHISFFHIASRLAISLTLPYRTILTLHIPVIYYFALEHVKKHASLSLDHDFSTQDDLWVICPSPENHVAKLDVSAYDAAKQVQASLTLLTAITNCRSSPLTPLV